jgi:hypothetical protein
MADETNVNNANHEQPQPAPPAAMEPGPEITLKANDGGEFKIGLNFAKASGTLADNLDDLGDGDVLKSHIPLGNIDSANLAKVIEYLVHYKGAPPSEDLIAVGTFTDWDKAFLPKDTDELFVLTMAADYMGVSSLLHMCARHIATCIKGKTKEEIDAFMGVKVPLTKQQEEDARKHPAWVNDPCLVVK